nr:hypothetical protein [Clostridia bacterium]
RDIDHDAFERIDALTRDQALLSAEDPDKQHNGDRKNRPKDFDNPVHNRLLLWRIVLDNINIIGLNGVRQVKNYGTQNRSIHVKKTLEFNDNTG